MKKKFNIIDVIVLLVLVAAVAFVGISVFNKDNGGEAVAVTEETRSLRFEVICQDVSPLLADNLMTIVKAAPTEENAETKNRIFNSNKLINATVLDCRTEPRGDGVDVIFTVEGEANFSSENYSIGNQHVRVGKNYLLKTMEIELQCVVLSMEQINE